MSFKEQENTVLFSIINTWLHTFSIFSTEMTDKAFLIQIKMEQLSWGKSKWGLLKLWTKLFFFFKAWNIILLWKWWTKYGYLDLGILHIFLFVKGISSLMFQGNQWWYLLSFIKCVLLVSESLIVRTVLHYEYLILEYFFQVLS